MISQLIVVADADRKPETWVLIPVLLLEYVFYKLTHLHLKWFKFKNVLGIDSNKIYFWRKKNLDCLGPYSVTVFLVVHVIHCHYINTFLKFSLHVFLTSCRLFPGHQFMKFFISEVSCLMKKEQHLFRNWRLVVGQSRRTRDGLCVISGVM